MNWYQVAFSIDQVYEGDAVNAMEWFREYISEQQLLDKAILYESDEITEEGIKIFIYCTDPKLMDLLKEKLKIEPSAEPSKEEICLVVGDRRFGDSLFDPPDQ